VKVGGASAALTHALAEFCRATMGKAVRAFTDIDIDLDGSIDIYAYGYICVNAYTTLLT